MFSTDDDMQPDLRNDGSGMFGGTGPGTTVEDLGSYHAGALVNPDAGLATNIPIAEGKRKLPPAVAIGWGALALLLALIAAMVLLAPTTVVSVLPGSARLYALMGKPVGSGDLVIQNVHSAWSNADGQNVLQVTGEIVNATPNQVGVPTVVVALQDKSGKELGQFTANVPPLNGGAKSPFMVQISSPPDNVSSLKVRFAKAD